MSRIRMSGGLRVSTDEGASGPEHCNLRTMSVEQLGTFFLELAPLAKYHCNKHYGETLTTACTGILARHAERTTSAAARVFVDLVLVDHKRADDSVAAVWRFARAHVRRFPHLRDTAVFRAYARDGDTILDTWLGHTNAFVDRLRDANVQHVTTAITCVEKPSDDHWAHAHAMLDAVLRHASAHAPTAELRALCLSLCSLGPCSAPFASPKALYTAQWLTATESLDAFRYVLECNGGRFLDAQWSTGTWSGAGHAWHADMGGLSLLLLKDLAVPMPWRGLGFSRLLRALECTLALTSSATRVHGLFLHYVHHDMLALTMAKGAHGYRMWTNPCDPATPGDAPFVHALEERALDAIQSGANPRAQPWMYAFTEHYGSAPDYGEIFHMVWLTPLGERLVAAQARPPHPVLVPLGLLEEQVDRASVFIADYVHALGAFHKSPWETFELEGAACDCTVTLRMRSSRALLKGKEPWALSVHVVPPYTEGSLSVCEARAYHTFLAFMGEVVRCLCDTLVYADASAVARPPSLIQLMVHFADEHVARESPEVGADLQAVFGDEFVGARKSDRAGVAAYLVQNRQVRYAPL